MFLNVSNWIIIGYIIFGAIMGFRLIPMAKTKTERILTLIVSGPVIWVLFSFYYIREVVKKIKEVY